MVEMNKPHTIDHELGSADEFLPIRSVDIFPISVPLKKPMKMASSEIVSAENLVVRMEAENGVVGWGEATFAPAMTGDILAGMSSAVRDHLKPLLVGKNALNRAGLMHSVDRALVHNSGAKCAVELALTDLVGRNYQIPFYELLGGALRDSVEPMWLLGGSTIEETVDEAVEQYSRGYKFQKIKVGVSSVEQEIQTTLAVRNALGPEAKLCADANTGWTQSQALRYLRGTGSAELIYLEQPLAERQIHGMAALNATGLVPIGGDECIGGGEDVLRYGMEKAISGVNLKIIKAGGAGPVMKAAKICEALGLSITLAGKVSGTSISAAAALALGCAVPNLDWGVSLTHIYLADDIVKNPISMQDGKIDIRRTPGLGIEVDEQALEKYTVQI